ncbi:hypothetical protein L208DRAFT_1269262, partial [Tricholoma matsutake]
LIPHDVKTHWNSTYNMLKMANQYHHAINDLIANKLLKLQQYELDENDWVILEDLLHIYKEATMFFSGDTQMMIVHVIPTMDCIDTLLKSLNPQPLSLSVKWALKFAHAIINKYYSKVDLLNVYCITIGECHSLLQCDKVPQCLCCTNSSSS